MPSLFMKLPLLITVLAIAAPLFSFSQSTTKASTTSGKLEQGIMQIEQELVAALTKGNAAPFERYLANTYSFTGPDGSTQNKAQRV